MRRLVLVRHASTAAVASAAFAADEPLDDGGRAAARALCGRLPPAGDILVSPALRARETATLAGLDSATATLELAECDFGTWSGRTLAAVNEEDPAAVRAWMTDPAAAPHGGESLTALLGRVGAWLDEQTALEGVAIAVTHGGVIRAAVVHALRAPPSALWQVEVAPASITELRAAHDGGGGWTLARVNCGASHDPTDPSG